jgi:hypothetical protein
LADSLWNFLSSISLETESREAKKYIKKEATAAVPTAIRYIAFDTDKAFSRENDEKSIGAPFWLVLLASGTVVLSVTGMIAIIWRDYRRQKKHH